MYSHFHRYFIAKCTQIHQRDYDIMNPLPPIRPAHQPIQREPSEYNCEEVREIIYRFKIYTQLEILYEYLERNDPKMLLKV